MPKAAAAALLSEEAFRQHFGITPADTDAWLIDRGLEALPTVDAAPVGGARWPFEEALQRLTEELTARQVAQILGYRSHRLVYQNGFFPDPDSHQVGAGGQRTRLRWRLLTVIRWDVNRPGSGRRVVPRQERALPVASWEGPLERLVFAPEAAALLGFSNEESFRSSLHQNNLPELMDKLLPSGSWEGASERLVAAPEVAALLGFSSVESFLSRLPGNAFPELQHSVSLLGGGGGCHEAWPLALIREVAERYGTDLERTVNSKGRRAQAWPLALVAQVAERRGQLPDRVSCPHPDGDLWGTAQVAAALGYATAGSFNSALRRGAFPELSDPDATRCGIGGRPKRFWRAKRVTSVAADRGLQAVDLAVPPSVIASWGGDRLRLVPLPEVAVLLGFSSAESFRTSMDKGHFPEFKDRHLPEGSWEGRPGRLVTAPEAAALLGFGSADSFLSRLSPEAFPELQKPGEGLGEYGQICQAWPLSLIKQVSQRLGTDLERMPHGEGQLARAWTLELVARAARRRGHYPDSAGGTL